MNPRTPLIPTAEAPTAPATPRATAPGRSRAVAGVLPVLFVAALTACASAPPPTAAMDHWQSARHGAQAEAIEDAEPHLAEQADEAYAAAERAHAEGDTVARAQALRLADVYWRTARTRYLAEQEQEALDHAEAQIAQKEGTLAALEGDVDRLRAEIVETRGEAVASGARPMPTSEQEKAEYVLDTAVVDLGRADEVEAEIRAPLLYTKATLAYDEAARAYGQGRFEQAIDRATRASTLARDAYGEALPGWREDALDARLEQRKEQLMSRLLRVGTPIVSEGEVSVSLVGLFPDGQDGLRPAKMSTLDTLADIAEAFPEYRIRVVGHTGSAGHPTDNLMLSQARALEVRRALEDRGVARDRLTSVGHGEQHAIADADVPGGEVINRRIDVVFEPRPVEIVEVAGGRGR